VAPRPRPLQRPRAHPGGVPEGALRRHRRSPRADDLRLCAHRPGRVGRASVVILPSPFLGNRTMILPATPHRGGFAGVAERRPFSVFRVPTFDKVGADYVGL